MVKCRSRQCRWRWPGVAVVALVSSQPVSPDLCGDLSPHVPIWRPEEGRKTGADSSNTGAWKKSRALENMQPEAHLQPGSAFAPPFEESDRPLDLSTQARAVSREDTGESVPAIYPWAKHEIFGFGGVALGNGALSGERTHTTAEPASGETLASKEKPVFKGEPMFEDEIEFREEPLRKQEPGVEQSPVFAESRGSKQEPVMLVAPSLVGAPCAGLWEPTPAFIEEVSLYAASGSNLKESDILLKRLSQLWLQQYNAPCACGKIRNPQGGCEECSRVCQKAKGVRLVYTQRPTHRTYRWITVNSGTSRSFSARKLGWRGAYSQTLRQAIEDAKTARRGELVLENFSWPNSDTPPVAANFCLNPPPWQHRRARCPACAAGRPHSNAFEGVEPLEYAALDPAGRLSAHIRCTGWRLNWLHHHKEERAMTIHYGTFGTGSIFTKVVRRVHELSCQQCECGLDAGKCNQLQLTKLFRYYTVGKVGGKNRFHVGATIESFKAAAEKAAAFSGAKSGLSGTQVEKS